MWMCVCVFFFFVLLSIDRCVLILVCHTLCGDRFKPRLYHIMYAVLLLYYTIAMQHLQCVMGLHTFYIHEMQRVSILLGMSADLIWTKRKSSEHNLCIHTTSLVESYQCIRQRVATKRTTTTTKIVNFFNFIYTLVLS